MMSVVIEILVAVWHTLTEMSPYLLFGFIVAGFLSVAVRQETVERHIGGKGIMPVLKATLFGVPLPLCSCGVIAVTVSLRKHGASKGATMGFLLSTPQTGVDSIMVTYGLLGAVFAIARPVVAFLTGIIGGTLFELLDGDNAREKTEGIARCQDECCAPKNRRNWLLSALRYAFLILPRDIAMPLLGGVLIAGVIASFVPPDFFVGLIGTGFVGMLVMMLVGIPLYVCATASIPIAAALIMKGVSPGAALVFLITGPATNAAAIATIWKIMGRRYTFVYLGTVAVTALLAGLALDRFFVMTAMQPMHMTHAMLPAWFGNAGAIALLLVFGLAKLPPPAKAQETDQVGKNADIYTLNVSGMTCNACAASVEHALRRCEGVLTSSVDLRSGSAVVTGTGCDPIALCTAVENLGYKAVVIA